MTPQMSPDFRAIGLTIIPQIREYLGSSSTLLVTIPFLGQSPGSPCTYLEQVAAALSLDIDVGRICPVYVMHYLLQVRRRCLNEQMVVLCEAPNYVKSDSHLL